MSTESWFPVITADAQKPNGSLHNAAVASASLPGKNVRNGAGSGNPPEDDSVLSIAVAEDGQGPGEVRPSVSVWDGLAIRPTLPVPRKEQKGSLRRIFRAGAGVLGMLILLLVFTKWVLLPIVLPMTNDAWTNAPLRVVRAPNVGNAQVRLDIGQAVEEGDTFAVLSNSDVDPSLGAKLRADIAMAKAEQTKHRSDLEAAKDHEQRANRGLEQYRRTRIDGLRASLQEAEAKIKERWDAHEQSKKKLDRIKRLGSSGSREELDKAIETEKTARDCLEQAQASRDRISIELQGAKENVFPQGDTPPYLTLLLEMRLRIPQLQAQLAETEGRLAAMEEERKELEEHANRLASSTVCSPVSGVVRSRNMSCGPVAKGESLLEIAETKRQYVEALFPDRHARSLYPGARVVIVFSGLAPFEGTVRAVRQPSPTDHDWASAIRLPRRLNQLTVLIDFESPPPDASLLGRPCQVLAADPSNPAHAWAAKLFCFLRW